MGRGVGARRRAAVGMGGAAVGGESVEYPGEAPDELLGGDVSGHGCCRCRGAGVAVGGYGRETNVPGGYAFVFRRRWSGVLEFGGFEGDGSEDVGGEQV